MGYTRAEAEKRIARDDGAPDETVYAIGGRASKAYHAISTCRQLQWSDRDPEAMTRDAAQARSLVPCTSCILEDLDRSDSGRMLDSDLIESARKSLQARDAREQQ